MYGSGRSTRHEHGDVGADGQIDFIFPVPVSGGSFGFEKPEYPGLDAVSYRGIQPVSAGTAKYCRTGCMHAAVHRRITAGGIGGGDIKLTAACGIVLGFHRAFTGLFLALCLLAVWHSVYVAAGKIRRKKRETGKGQAYPLAPFLWIGMLVSVISAGCM